MWHYRIIHMNGRIEEDSVNAPAPFKGYRSNGEAFTFGKLALEGGNYDLDEYSFELYEVVEQHSMKQVYVIYEREQKSDNYGVKYWIYHNLLIPFYSSFENAQEAVNILNSKHISPKNDYKVNLFNEVVIEVQDRYFIQKINLI